MDYNSISGLKIIQKSLSSKTVLVKDHPALKEAIRSYFIQTYALYQKLFEIIACHQAFYTRPEPLRHPLIFYYGHTACVYINKCLDYDLLKERINPYYQKIFAVGVDQMDWDDLNENHYDWPSVPDTTAFRRKAKQAILDIIDGDTTEFQMNTWRSKMWVIIMGIQHERIHLETSAVIMRRLPIAMIKQVEDFVQCPNRKQNLELIPKNQLKRVSAWKGTWKKTLQNFRTYGWDNQFGNKKFDVKEYKASQMLVSNGEFLAFVQDGGYSTPQWWTTEGQRWLTSVKPTMPLFWRKEGDSYRLRTLSAEIAMPWDWPAEVNNLQARAFCKWRTIKTGKYTRLPTEDEWHALRSLLPVDQPEWEYQSVGNINMEFWMSPSPVDMFRHDSGFYDIVGNVWQHTITPIYPFRGFEIHSVYQDFTTPTFDDRHDIIKGGSFISTGAQALKHARYAFRRHFHQFAGFRYIETDIQMEVDSHSETVVQDNNVEMNLKHHYLNQDSYVLEVAEKIKETAKDSHFNRVLTIGCSVGRIPLQLGKTAEESIGIDYTTRYFQMSTRLKEKGFLKFKDIDIDLKELGLLCQNVALIQMNPQNPDDKKVCGCDCIVIDGYALKKGSLSTVLSHIPKLTSNRATIFVLNVSNINSLSKEQEVEILRKASGALIEVGEEQLLQATEKDQGYLPGRESKMSFRLNTFYYVKS